MTLLIKEAERNASSIGHRLARGKHAIRALQWLTQPDLIKNAQLRLASQWGSASSGVGNSDALEYLNTETSKFIEVILEKAIRQAQQDMDSCLGSQADVEG